MYVAGMSVAVRRQVDKDPRSICFLRFLGEVKANPTVASRERYTGFFRGKGLPDLMANHDFDKHVGVGLDHVDPCAVDKEIETLRNKADVLRSYVNKRIAHHDEEEFTNFPKFQDVDDAIEYLEYLLKRYLLLFRGVGITQILPIWQYDWKAVFRVPWIDAAPSGGQAGKI